VFVFGANRVKRRKDINNVHFGCLETNISNKKTYEMHKENGATQCLTSPLILVFVNLTQTAAFLSHPLFRIFSVCLFVCLLVCLLFVCFVIIHPSHIQRDSFSISRARASLRQTTRAQFLRKAHAEVTTMSHQRMKRLHTIESAEKKESHRKKLCIQLLAHTSTHR
jgi:hypothetical protein